MHALADAKGRLLAILLTGGEAHDCPAAKRLIRRVKSPKCLLGDKAYDSAERCTKEIRVYNNTPGPIWPVIQASIQRRVGAE